MNRSERYRTWSKSRAPRLPLTAYGHGFPVHVVLCTQDRQPFFSRWPQLAALAFEQVVQVPETLVACVMPDHLHWLLRIAGPPGGWVKPFKLATIQAARDLGIASRLWQRSYYDRILWTREGLEAAERYILENPVRAGLVTAGEDWPYSILRP